MAFDRSPLPEFYRTAISHFGCMEVATAGKGNTFVGSRRAAMEPGDILVIPEGTTVEAHHQNSSTDRRGYLVFPEVNQSGWQDVQDKLDEAAEPAAAKVTAMAQEMEAATAAAASREAGAAKAWLAALAAKITGADVLANRMDVDGGEGGGFGGFGEQATGAGGSQYGLAAACAGMPATHG